MMASRGIDGGVAETALDAVGLTANKNAIPDDSLPPFAPSGLRLGTPALTTRGLAETDMVELARWIDSAIENHDQPAKLAELHKEVIKFAKKYPLPSDG
jgi:glycine hydroxymethyltransferase